MRDLAMRRRLCRRLLARRHRVRRRGCRLRSLVRRLGFDWYTMPTIANPNPFGLAGSQTCCCAVWDRVNLCTATSYVRYPFGRESSAVGTPRRSLQRHHCIHISKVLLQMVP